MSLRFRLAASGHHNEREAPPRQQSVDEPPQPHGLVEQFQRDLVNTLATEQLSVQTTTPPRSYSTDASFPPCSRHAPAVRALPRLKNAVCAPKRGRVVHKATCLVGPALSTSRQASDNLQEKRPRIVDPRPIQAR